TRDGKAARKASRPPDPRKRKQEEERLTQTLERRERELKELEASLADPSVYADVARTKELLHQYETARRDVDALWAELAALTEPGEAGGAGGTAPGGTSKSPRGA